ncbi:MAG TPA: hypothetical protein VI386_15445 [Candidatus Sulfotelmatobacter sp.]
MKLTTSILAISVMAGGAWAQNPDAIDNARSVAKSLQQKQTIDTNAALDAVGVPAKPASSSAPQNTSGAAQKSGANVVQKTSARPAAKTAKPGQAGIRVAAQDPKPVAGKAQKIAPADVKAAVEAKVASNASKSAQAGKAAPLEEKKWSLSGKRDPFFSPVVQQQGGSGCSTGKKCLEIGHINVRGVVKSDNGFIAVVTNDLNKAYFLRENDPVFNGYVVRITGDSVVFQETVQDKLGKPFTREIVKRIFTPAV